MHEAEADLRDRLAKAGLADRADALVELALPSIRLRSGREASEPKLVRGPEPVWGLQGGVRAVAGGYHNLALRDDGIVVAWGANGSGQLGDGTATYRRSPVVVRGLTEVSAIAVGAGHSLALTGAGGVFAWGSNEWGELGDGTRTSRHTAAPVPGLEQGVVAVAAGDNHSLALQADGSVLGWGLNVRGAIGIDNIPPGPVSIPGLPGNVVAIAAGGTQRLALTAEGTVMRWGPDTTTYYVSRPAPIEGLPTGVRAIAASTTHSLALSSEGGVIAWGEGFFYLLGDGSSEKMDKPVQVAGLDVSSMKGRDMPGARDQKGASRLLACLCERRAANVKGAPTSKRRSVPSGV